MTDEIAYSISDRKPEGKNHWEDQGVYGKILLEWISRNRVGGYVLDASDSG
jgi:hypothetical protein